MTGPLSAPMGPVRRAVARLVAALVATALVGAMSVLTGAPSAVSAAQCGALVVTPRPQALPPSLLVAVPSSLSGQPVPRRSWSVDQQGPVPVASARVLKPSKLDLAIVLDTAAEAPDRVYRRARAVVTALLDSLPAEVRVTVVSAGGTADVLSPLGTDRVEADDGVTDAPRGPGHAWLDAIVHAANALPDLPGRFAQVVVVTTGPDDASVRDLDHVRSLLDARPVALSVTAAGPPAAPDWGDRCPPEVAGGEGDAAGELMARRIAGQYVVVAPAADLAEPLTVRLRSDVVDVSAAAVLPATASDAEVLGTKVGRPAPGGGGIAWVPIGLGVLAVVLLGAVSVPLLSSTGHPVPFLSRLPGARKGTRSTQRDPLEEDLLIEAWMARGCLLSLLPAALVARLLRGEPGVEGATGLLVLVLAVVLGAAGAWWLWWSTSPPYPMWPGRPGSEPQGPRVTAVAPFCLCLLPAVLLIALG